MEPTSRGPARLAGGRPAEPSLLGVQQEFLDGILARPKLDTNARALRFEEPPRGSVAERWSIYADGLHGRVAEAVENDHPALRRILGEGPFGSLVARYVVTCPPASYDLGRAGDRLVAFLATDPLTADLPFLPDLARFERALADAFVARDAQPLSWADFAALDPARLLDLPLAVLPGTAALRSPWPLADLWACRLLADGDVQIELAGHPSALLVRRRGLAVEWGPADDLDLGVVEAALDGRSLGDLEAAAADEAGAAALVAAFRRLVDDGLFDASMLRGAGASGGHSTIIQPD